MQALRTYFMTEEGRNAPKIILVIWRSFKEREKIPFPMSKKRFAVGDIFPASEEESASRSSLTGHRRLRQYRNLLKLGDDDLRAKTILDIGSGLQMRFAQEVKKSFPESRVISYDYAFADASLDRSQIPEGLEYQAGLISTLPFPADTFDLVVSMKALPMWVDEEVAEKGFRESVRVLKPGGVGKFFPFMMRRRVVVESMFTQEQLREHYDRFTNEQLRNADPHLFRVDGEYIKTDVEDIQVRTHFLAVGLLLERLNTSLPVEIDLTATDSVEEMLAGEADPASALLEIRKLAQ